jgi:hypothetical protein
MPRTISDLLSTTMKISDHVAATVIRGDQVVGFSESQRQGRAAHGTLTSDGSVDHGFSGPSPTGETGTLDACVRLVRHLNAGGEHWKLPAALTDGLPHVDCQVQSDGGDSDCLNIQEVRAMTDTAHWHEVGRDGGREVAGESPDDGADALKRSIELKQNKIPSDARAGLVLLLDANDTPALTFDAVVSSFRAKHGSWASSVGFQATWLVGPMIPMVHRLA